MVFSIVICLSKIMASLLPPHPNNTLQLYSNTCHFTINVHRVLLPSPPPPIITLTTLTTTTTTTTDTKTNTNTNTNSPKLIIRLLIRVKHVQWSNSNTILKLTIPFLNQKQICAFYKLSEFVNDNSIMTHALTSALSSALVGPLISHAKRQETASQITAEIRSKIPSTTEEMILNGNTDVFFEVEFTILRSFYLNTDDHEETKEEEEDDDGVQVHGENCVICFDELGAETGVFLSCGHKLFHKMCIINWLITKDTCPLCRCTLMSRRS